ncbi:uncharacterized protein LOC134533498 [Bacillus rossius redtenbacheri]|uniref:uncharacterized protein LOC134533498 n=1 Tax=Bacillus rossius redtenbacheri TaxID=93214 RepID=UPI002FDDDA46
MSNLNAVGKFEYEVHEKNRLETLKQVGHVIDTSPPISYILRQKKLNELKLQEKQRKDKTEPKMMKKIEFYNADGEKIEQIMKVFPSCFLVVQEYGGPVLGRIVVELNGACAPQTALNFLTLCRGDAGLSYKGCPFHFVLPGILCSAGDVTRFDGRGGTSLYGRHFCDETNDLKHDGPGVLSMESHGRNKNDSKFNITFKASSMLNGKFVVFGRVTSGHKILQKIEDYGSKTGVPRTEVIISNCGEVL